MGRVHTLLGTCVFWTLIQVAGPMAAAQDEPVYGFAPRPSCVPMAESDPVVWEDDFKRHITLEEMKASFEAIYHGPKRLLHRAYYDPETQSYVMEQSVGGKMKPIRLNPRFIRSIIRHVEIALERRYADFIFMPDMGHSHFHFPKRLSEQLRAIPNDESDRVYQMLVDLPEAKVVYHTAEHLRVTTDPPRSRELLTDRTLQWRYYNRNVVGDFVGGETTAPYYAWDNNIWNTLKELPGMEEWSSAFNISANESACFPYQYHGQTFYFDLSWFDLPSQSGGFDSVRMVD